MLLKDFSAFGRNVKYYRREWPRVSGTSVRCTYEWLASDRPIKRNMNISPRGFSQSRCLIYCATVWLEVGTKKMSASRSPCAIWRKWRTFAGRLRMSQKKYYLHICPLLPTAGKYPLESRTHSDGTHWPLISFVDHACSQKNAFIKISKRIVCVVHSNARACAFAKSHSHFGWFVWENTQTFHDGCRDEKHRT